MSEFDVLLTKYTEKGNAKVHGAVCKCVDKNGNELYSKISGYDSLSPDASLLREDAVFRGASSTKLITSIALLQCVERGLVGLDQPLTKILPELDAKVIVKGESESGELILEPSKNKITPRHLLTHTSGLGYPFTHPLLMKYAELPEMKPKRPSNYVAEKYDSALAFEPGTGWLYGSSLDWAGVTVRRLNNGISLEDYMIENIWKKVGLSSPFPTFNISRHPEYLKRLMQTAERTSKGGLQDCIPAYGDNPVDGEGGAGLTVTVKDYIAVLTDLISDSPKLLKSETVSLMFTPQIVAGSEVFSDLIKLRPAWETVSGPIENEVVNHGLGGLLVLGASELGQPKNVLAWGGASNTIWFACRDVGVAGFFATQISPFGDHYAKNLINGWKKDFWSKFNAKGHDK